MSYSSGDSSMSSAAAAAAAAGSSLIQAVRSGDAQQVAALLQQGADVNSPDQDGQYVLALAVQQLTGDVLLEVLDALLASPGIAVEAFAAALHAAAAACGQEALQHLLSWQQLAQQAVNMKVTDGCTALCSSGRQRAGHQAAPASAWG
uniref:Uncharacterized protein n=1 Tax=Tetradesmus obliquus TaxID=3088 RepID=A0A383VBK4_TETOB|eukprot:jgi/Sobl393_1/13085/SZX62938.1